MQQILRVARVPRARAGCQRRPAGREGAVILSAAGAKGLLFARRRQCDNFFRMPLTRDDIRESVERAGDEHWDALRHHHEDAYPNPKPTPGDVCKGEAERLNRLGLGDAKEFALIETRVERVGDEVRLTHVLEYKPLGVRLLTEPFQDYK